MIQSFDLLDLTITLTPPLENAPVDTLASITLRCEALGLHQKAGLLIDPLTQRERTDLRWYLETYPDWPFAEFATRGKQIEDQLAMIGQRLYQTTFGAGIELIMAWQSSPAQRKQITIVSAIPAVLSLPWELLHNDQGFLVLCTDQPISLLRRLDQKSLPALATTFTPPLRILVLTPRPKEIGFLDPRVLARELLEVVQPQIDAGTITVEFLRPPTRAALHERLRDVSRPVHVLHFDGHGFFGDQKGGTQGMLAFEDEEWGLDLVSAEDLGQLLEDSGVRLAMLDACQSAVSSAADAFSSVAGRLIQSSVDAVVAMSASVLTPTSTRFFACFYRDLATGISVPLAQEHARQDLYDHPHRYLFTPHPDVEEGQPVSLRDWWLPHLYQQRPLTLQATSTPQMRVQVTPALSRFNAAMPPEPRYRFGGRAWELLQIERYLLSHQLVILSGFGGIGKTALAREAADWFTRTDLYASACFVSFEHGGDASLLLGELGTQLDVNDGNYTPQDPAAALTRLLPVLHAHSTLIIADNLESLLPEGEAPLEQEGCQQLWHLLHTLANLGVGVLLTSRDPLEQEEELATSLDIAHISLLGLVPFDAYTLASRLLTTLAIDRALVPYVELRILLEQLAYQPLALQLVLPALREHPLAQILSDFTRLLPTFNDDTATGHNRSLLASLEYSLHRLSAKQRDLLSRLAVFEGGARESDLLIITRISKNHWTSLEAALLQSALLILEPIEGFSEPFLRFHPILTPFLHSQTGVLSAHSTMRNVALVGTLSILTPFLRGQIDVLNARFITRYVAVAGYLEEQDAQHPQAVRALFAKELPNLRRALALLLAQGHQQALEEAIELVDNLARLLSGLGRWRERDALRQLLAGVLTEHPFTTKPGTLTRATYLRESGLGQDELSQGNLGAASARFARLLAVIEARSAKSPRGLGSHEHCLILVYLARCLDRAGQLVTAEDLYRQALTILSETLLRRQPKNTLYLELRGAVLSELANFLRSQGRYSQAREFYLQALAISQQLGNRSAQAVDEGLLGNLALEQGDLVEASQRHLAALATFQELSDPGREAEAWHNLGVVAELQKQWAEAERCYRTSLALQERQGNPAWIALACNQLASIAWAVGRPTEAEAWYRRALAADVLANPGHPNATLLRNLARLLVDEVRSERAAPTNLTEAHTLAEQALALRTNRDASPEIWYDLETLARLAELEKLPGQARDLRRHAREAYAAFPRHHLDLGKQMGSLITEIAAATRGDETTRQQVTVTLLQWEAKGWHLTAPTQRLWSGERDWATLVEELDNQDALLILLVLEALPTSAEIAPIPPTNSLLAELLPTARTSLQQGDQAAFAQTLTEPTPDETQRVFVRQQALQTSTVDAEAEADEHR